MQRCFVILCAIASLVACGTQQTGSSPQSALAATREQLIADLGHCTRTSGYDPKNVTGVAENQLAQHELEWRQCGYDAVRKYARTQPSRTDRYEQLINEDISMTNAIQSGAMTRSQRRQQIDALITQIKDAEQSQAQSAAAEQQQERERVRQMVEGMRGFY
jgi:hypothetical protein